MQDSQLLEKAKPLEDFSITIDLQNGKFTIPITGYFLLDKKENIYAKLSGSDIIGDSELDENVALTEVDKRILSIFRMINMTFLTFSMYRSSQLVFSSKRMNEKQISAFNDVLLNYEYIDTAGQQTANITLYREFFKKINDNFYYISSAYGTATDIYEAARISREYMKQQKLSQVSDEDLTQWISDIFEFPREKEMTYTTEFSGNKLFYRRIDLL